MTRDECLSIFKQYNYTEHEIANIIVLATGCADPIEMHKLPTKGYLDSNLDIVYNNGKRHKRLAEAIKNYVLY